MQNLVAEFRQFISRGNVIDLAVGVIVGGAFGNIVNSLVKDIIMPPIGLVLGGVNFVDLKLILQKQSITPTGQVVPEVAIMYGSFLQVLINFLIIAFTVFLMVKLINKLQEQKDKLLKKQEKADERKIKQARELSAEEKLLTEIRDLLQNQTSARKS